jgi:hypothetical protein
VTAVLATASVLLLAGAASLIPSLLTDAGCAPGGDPDAPASAATTETIPASYLALYQQTGTAYRIPWTVLAAIGAIESDHGRSRALGVQSGVNAFGCCAGPMQFNLRNGPPSTWQSYRVDGDRDGDIDPYDPTDAIASAARYLRALLDQSGGDVTVAIYGYNHSRTYVADVLTRARAYSTHPEAALAAPETAGCAADTPITGPMSLRRAERRETPREYTTLPAWAMAGGRPAQPIDARLLDDALGLLRSYRLRVTAAREPGHNTHGDGTALDLVPVNPVDQQAWDGSAGALARDLGWTRACAASGVRPVCPLVPAIRFVGYDGYPGHGSPRTCGPPCAAHLHVSWDSPCYGTSAPSEPCAWVNSFGRAGDARATSPAPHPSHRRDES